jgi:recombinational DNA repair protein (RecF pathway)
MIHNLRAIVLWSRRSRDADKIVGMYTDQMGRLTARATSAARSSAKFGALTEPFVESDLAVYLVPGHGWGKIVGGQLRQSFPELRTSLERITAASWVCECVYRLTPEEQPSPEKFELLHETLEAIASAPEFNLIRLGFVCRFLNFAGFGLDNRDAWMALQKDHPQWADSLMQMPLRSLSAERWVDPQLKALEQLAGSVVNDHLAIPLNVNRFRQMTGIEI